MGWMSAAIDTARSLLALPKPMTLDLQPLHVFDTAPRPVDQVISAMKYGDPGRVSRIEALSVAAVQRGRNELAAIATLPLRQYRGSEPVQSALFRQFNPNTPNVVHLAQTVEDLAFEGIAWWEVTGRGYDGFPVMVRRIEPAAVSFRDPTAPALNSPAGVVPTPGVVWVDLGDGAGARQVRAQDMIRFDSPNPGILSANARAIRIAIALDRLTELYARNPALREYFTDNTEEAGVDPMSDEDIDAFLAQYSAMRQVSPTGWIPGTVKAAALTTPNPRDLTLVDLRQSANLAIANGLGVDPEDLGVSTTSRTYFNANDRRQDKVNRTYGPFMKAITDRLSMGDVTKNGYTVQFDLTAYMQADPATRIAYYEGLQRMGVVDEQWIAEQEGVSPAVAARAAATVEPAPAAPLANRAALRVVAHAAPARVQFAAPLMRFSAGDFSDDVDVPAPTVNMEARTITGLAVPYNATASQLGIRYSFMPGSLEYSDPARMAHLKDHTTPVGFHRSVTDTAQGPMVELAVLDAPEGSPAKIERDQLLYDAANGLYSGLSVGVDFSMNPDDGDVEYDAESDTYRVLRASWRETSTTYMPAFDDARVTTVAASLTGGNVFCQHCGGAHAPGIACATFAAALRTQPTPMPAPTPAPTPGDPAPPAPGGDAATFAQFQAFIAGQQQAALPAPGPVLVDPTGSPIVVNEPLPYRYDRSGFLGKGSHDFSSDIVKAYHPDAQEDRAAPAGRIQAWLKHAFENRDLGRLDAPTAMQKFAITPANVVNLNYPANRPDLYVDQLDYLYPMYDFVNKGTLADVTPFVVPKFSASSGLVADHVSGTEPTPGAFTAAAQTITPSALSGKVEILREAFDQGGNPQMSGLIWRQMTRAWYEGAEAAVQAFLVANAASIPDIALGTAVTDAAMDQSIASAITALQYIRGGDRFSRVFTQIDLYQKLAKAVDTAGRPLYPTFGAMNTSGSMAPDQNYLNVRGKTFIPAWATAATGSVVASSWMLDPDVVCMWLSTPQRIDIQWRVAWVDMGIWGYKALAVTDFSRTRELTYDPV